MLCPFGTFWRKRAPFLRQMSRCLSNVQSRIKIKIFSYIDLKNEFFTTSAATLGFLLQFYCTTISTVMPISACVLGVFGGLRWKEEGALCVQMDFTRTFETTPKCNNINHVWSHFYKILVVLKYHRRPWANIFDTDIFRSINIPKNAKYTTLM